MIRPPPSSTLTDTLLPYPTLFRPPPTQRRALGHDITIGSPSAADKPLGQAGVQAACYRVFGHSKPGHESAYFELSILAVKRRIPRADHANAQALERGEVGTQIQYPRTRIQQHGPPARPVVHPPPIPDFIHGTPPHRDKPPHHGPTDQ